MEEGIRKTDKVEIKYKEFNKGKTKHPPKKQDNIEINLILEGKIRGTIDTKLTTLKAGQYIVVSPNASNNIIEEVIEPTKIFTIKAPSNPSAKHLIN